MRRKIKHFKLIVYLTIICILSTSLFVNDRIQLQVYAVNTVKDITKVFPKSINVYQNQTVTIDGLINVNSVSTTTGTVTYTVNGTSVKLTLNNGTPQPETPSAVRSDYRQNTSNAFDLQIYYNQGGYSGYISKSGSSYVSSGSAAGSKYTTGSLDTTTSTTYEWNGSSWIKVSETSANNPSIPYGPDSDQYSGTLYKNRV